MSDNVDFLPIWKRDGTVADRLSELSLIARKFPERFTKMAFVYEEARENNRTVIRSISANCTTNELVGILTIAVKDVIEEARPPS